MKTPTIFVLSIFSFFALVEDKRCVEDRNGKTLSYCCDNFEEDINGTCTECKHGYASDMGEPCHICSIGYYGHKCGDICKCVADRCHHVFGCVIPEITTVQQLQSTNNASPLLTMAEPIDQNTIPDEAGKLPTSPTRTPSTAETSVFQGLNRREIIVYSCCTGLVLFILLICTFLLRRYKLRNANTHPFIHSTSPEQNVHAIETPATDAPSEGVDGIYETIDESSISDFPIPTHATNHSNENDGSTSDDNSDPLPNDGYLNPYQPMTHEFERHGYSSIVNQSDSDCSSSGKGERVSVYLNPYQIVVPDQDKHEYCKVNDDLCIEKTNVFDISKQSPKDTYTDAQSFTPSRNIQHGESEYQCEKSKPSDYGDSLDINKKVQTSMCVAENELSHNKYIQTCDMELKLCINEHAKSTDKLERVGQCLEVRDTGDTPGAICHLNVI